MTHLCKPLVALAALVSPASLAAADWQYFGSSANGEQLWMWDASTIGSDSIWIASAAVGEIDPGDSAVVMIKVKFDCKTENHNITALYRYNDDGSLKSSSSALIGWSATPPGSVMFGFKDLFCEGKGLADAFAVSDPHAVRKAFRDKKPILEE